MRMMGGSTKTFGTPIFQGPPVTPPLELHFRQDPCLFRERLTDAFRMVGMGIVRLEEDAPTAAGAGTVMKPWPDDRTALRFSIVFDMFHKTMAVMASIARGQDVQVHNLNGSMAWVRFQHFSVTDALRLLVAETARHSISGRHAAHALDNIRLQEGEYWETGLNRLARIARAASVLPDRPYLAWTKDAFSRQAKQRGSSLALLEGETAGVPLSVDRQGSTSDSDADRVDAHVAAVDTAGDGPPATHAAPRAPFDSCATRPAGQSRLQDFRKRERTRGQAGDAGTGVRDSSRQHRTESQAPQPATRGQPAERGPPSGAPQLAADAPAPDADQTQIQKFIMLDGVCFNYATGFPCQRMMQDHHCHHLHTGEPIPVKAYPRPPSWNATTPVAAVQEYDENVLYAADAFASWTDSCGHEAAEDTPDASA
ncbi:unnamed protein product [Ectocarpus sp. CCAP 1310/34]|nr:unnamed protein product [Ectocarpus sp. CCAP 1310/34]